VGGEIVGLGLIILCKRRKERNIFGSCKALKCMLNRAPEKILFYVGLLLNRVLKAGKEDMDKSTKLQGMKICLF
jgi:hypothetical protein